MARTLICIAMLAAVNAALLPRPTFRSDATAAAAYRSTLRGTMPVLFTRGVARSQPLMMAEAATESPSETFEFEAEVSKVMDIIINSLYSDKDIFLRELISNASDACDKKRFLSLTDDGREGAYNGRIRLYADKEKNVLVIEDNGVGMTKKELQNNLGRIAQSGTKMFTEALGSGADATNLIGQFGVGFYSAFLVADKVTVVSKAQGEPQLRWVSEAASQYTISTDDSEPIENSGTRIILSMKEDADKYLDDFTLRDMLKRYSEFISFPIELWTEKTEYEQVVDTEAEVRSAPGACLSPPTGISVVGLAAPRHHHQVPTPISAEASVEVKEGEEPPKKTVPRTSKVWETVNMAKPLWMRDPKEVTADEYNEFYKTTFKAYDTPDAYTHFSLEGQVEFRAMLFCPSTVPWELSQDMFNDKVHPMKLFVKRVFISDKFDEQLLPRWLSFLKGLVDSEDLPLNVSRELLQKSRVLSIISKRLVRKALDMFGEIKKDPEKFKRFTSNFGRYIKVGVIEDQDNKEALLKYATFASSQIDGKEGTTLPEYVERMKSGQKQIYYISGSSRAAASQSPVLERLTKQGYEVLFALDQIDEIALQGVGKFSDFEVIDAAKENADLGEMSEEEKKQEAEAKADLKATCEYIKKVLDKKVDRVDVSSRLTSSPAALVQPQWGMSPQMQRFMKAQAAAAGTDDMMMGGMAANLEINPQHPVVLKLKAMVNEGTKSGPAEQYAMLLHEVAVVSSGYELPDPSAFAKRITALMADGEAGLAAMMSGVSSSTPTSDPDARVTTEVNVVEGGDIEIEVPSEGKSS